MAKAAIKIEVPIRYCSHCNRTTRRNRCLGVAAPQCPTCKSRVVDLVAVATYQTPSSK